MTAPLGFARLAAQPCQGLPGLLHPALQGRVGLVPQVHEAAIRECGGVSLAGSLPGPTQRQVGERDELVPGGESVAEPADTFGAGLRAGGERKRQLKAKEGGGSAAPGTGRELDALAQIPNAGGGVARDERGPPTNGDQTPAFEFTRGVTQRETGIDVMPGLGYPAAG